MIELIPAIDIIDGKCVRLTKGLYDSKKVYDDNPSAMAMKFESLGFKRLHVVDLDGARSKHVVNDIDVKRFQPNNHDEKVPAMGWNKITELKSPLFKGFEQDEYVYFVHSFYVPSCQVTIATSDYIQTFIRHLFMLF